MSLVIDNSRLSLSMKGRNWLRQGWHKEGGLRILCVGNATLRIKDHSHSEHGNQLFLIKFSLNLALKMFTLISKRNIPRLIVRKERFSILKKVVQD